MINVETIAVAIAAEIAGVERDRRKDKHAALLVHSWPLTYTVYNDHTHPNWEPSLAQRKAVTRAMRSFVRKHQQYALTGGQGRRDLYLYDTADPLSVMWAKLNVERRQRNPISRMQALTIMLETDEKDEALQQQAAPIPGTSRDEKRQGLAIFLKQMVEERRNDFRPRQSRQR
jgi:hypothetical protein